MRVLPLLSLVAVLSLPLAASATPVTLNDDNPTETSFDFRSETPSFNFGLPITDDFTPVFTLFANSFSHFATTHAASVAPTPEPSSMILLGSGLLGVIGAIRRRAVNA